MPLEPAPKDPAANVAYRRKVRALAQKDGEFRKLCWMRAARDPVWWCDTFLWTYSPKDHPECPHRPFVLWDYQEQVLLNLLERIGKRDVLIEKSREMGATWLVLLALAHRWMFKPGQSFLVGSRKQEYVEKTGDPKTLFWKLEYLINSQPGWMQPGIVDVELHLQNQDNGSTIDGESTNQDFATGDRRTAILLDEFAKVDNGHSIVRATRDVTRSRIFLSTPEGSSGAYYEMREKMMANTPQDVLRLPWHLHPEKNRGLYISDGSAIAPDHAGKVRSPWYDGECARALNEKEILQELDIDYQGSGWQLVAQEKLAAMLLRCKPPLAYGELMFDPDGRNPRFVNFGDGTGNLVLWTPLTSKGRLPDSSYVVSGDVAMGAGGQYSSRSALTVADRNTGRKVAQLASSSIEPGALAVYAVALAYWAGGALLIWESNGPGSVFTKRVKELGYANHFRRENEERYDRRKSDAMGWYTTEKNKLPLIQDYVTAVHEGRFDNPSEEAVREIGEYVNLGNGRVAHSKSRRTNNPNVEGDNHGDLVIADALAWRGIMDSPARRATGNATTEYPINSFGYRQQMRQREMREATYY